MTVLKSGAWPWLIPAALLIVIGFAVGGGAGSIILACGFLGLLGAGIRMISRSDSRPPETRRVPGGHSGV